jgi:hypothetical protein
LIIPAIFVTPVCCPVATDLSLHEKKKKKKKKQKSQNTQKLFVKGQRPQYVMDPGKAS